MAKGLPSDPKLSIFHFVRQYRYANCAGILLLVSTNALALAIPWIIKLAVDNIQMDPDPNFLKDCGLWILVLALGHGFLRVFSRIVIFGAGRSVEEDIRNKLYDHLQSLDAAFFDRTPNGEMVSLLTNDTNVVRLLFGLGFLNLINGVILYALVAFLMFSLNVELALWAMVPYVFIVFLIGKVSPRFHQKSRILQEKISDLTDFIQENVSGQEVLRSFHCRDSQEKRFGKFNQKYLDASMDLTTVRGLLFTSTGAIGGLGTLILLLVGGAQMIRGQIGLGDFIAFFGYLNLMVMPTLMFGFVISVWQRGRASLERIQKFLSQSPLVKDPKNPKEFSSETKSHRLTVKNLSFSYPSSIDSSPPQRLQNISFEIPAGKITALVGPVACGKSTLVKIFPKIYPVPSGTLFIDDQDINDLKIDEVRGLFTCVPQESFLFSRTVAENIAFGFPRDADPNRIGQAAQSAQVGLAQGEQRLTLDTNVGERGVLLSGGQKQRIGIARGWINEAPIVLWDEPFSSLDIGTAKNVMNSLKKTMAHKTIILITHKISLIQNVEQIIVMDQWKNVQIGQHRDLMENCDIYRALYAKEKMEHLSNE